jgi:Leucine-rich repeat (LRR) protein
MKNFYLLLFFFLTILSQAQIINFPDANFKAKLMQSGPSESIARDIDGNFVKIDTNLDNEIDVAEAAIIYFLEVNFGNINSISGIENFVNLLGLECVYNNLTILPVSSLINLDYVACSDNQITSLTEIENLTGLSEIGISDNPLTNINLSNLSQLWRLWAANTLLTEINLCGTNVRWLWAQDNANLTTLYVKNEVVSNDLARSASQIPPPLHNFEFYNSPLLTFICYDDGELEAVMHGISYNATGKTLTTSCDANCSLSVENPIANNQVSLYPNPTSGMINIIVSNNQPMDKITVSNVLGQNIMTFEKTETLDLSSLTKGTYFVTVETQSGKETRKIIKL